MYNSFTNYFSAKKTHLVVFLDMLRYKIDIEQKSTIPIPSILK